MLEKFLIGAFTGGILAVIQVIISKIYQHIKKIKEDKEDTEKSIFVFLEVLIKKGMIDDSTAVVFTNNFSVKFLKRKIQC